MPDTQEILVGEGGLSQRFSPWYGFAHPFMHLPGLRRLRPLAQVLKVVTAPTGKLTLRALPGSPVFPTRSSLTVLTANLWHDWYRHRQLAQRMEALAQVVESEQVDVALLQEVARTREIRVDEWLAERLGMAYAYVRANGDEQGIGFEEGLAIFSRHPLLKPTVRELGTAAGSLARRLVLGVTAHTPWAELPLFSTHLSFLPRANLLQVAHLQRWIEQVTGSAVALIGGDFNAPEKSSRMRRLGTRWIDAFRHLHPRADGTTHTLRWPWGGVLMRQRLDYLFLKPGQQRWRVVEARHIQTRQEPRSDHRMLLTRLAFAPTSTR